MSSPAVPPKAEELSLDNLGARGHLVLSALKHDGGALSAADILERIQTNVDQSAQALANGQHKLSPLAIPRFVSELTLDEIHSNMQRMLDAGWASYHNSMAQGRIYKLTKKLDVVLYLSKFSAPSKSVAQMQPIVVGAMIQILRSAGVRTVPSVRTLLFHHITCLVPFPAGVVGRALQTWCIEQTTIGPFPINLTDDKNAAKQMVTARIVAYTTERKKQVYEIHLTAETAPQKTA